MGKGHANVRLRKQAASRRNSRSLAPQKRRRSGGKGRERRRHNLARHRPRPRAVRGHQGADDRDVRLGPGGGARGHGPVHHAQRDGLELNEPQAASADYAINDGLVFGFRVDDVEAASAAVEAAGCELLGEITRVEEIAYAYRRFRGPDGRVYSLNEQN